MQTGVWTDDLGIGYHIPVVILNSVGLGVHHRTPCEAWRDIQTFHWNPDDPVAD